MDGCLGAAFERRRDGSGFGCVRDELGFAMALSLVWAAWDKGRMIYLWISHNCWGSLRGGW